MLSTELITMKNGKKLRLSRQGRGPALVFLHGYPDNLHLWGAVIENLGPDFERVAIDWPGMGESEAWPGGAAPKHMAERLLTILDELQLGQITLVASDMGGQAALEFAARFPDRIQNLVVMNSLVFGDEKTSWEIELLRKFGWNRWILKTLPLAIFMRARRTMTPPGRSLPSEILADFWRSFRRPEVRRFISKMCAGYQGSLPGLPARYAIVKCPTLILWGEKDPHFPVVQGQRLCRAIPHSRLEILSGASHWMAWTEAGRVAGAIRNLFLSSRLGS